MSVDVNDPVLLQILWNRLIHAADDAARTLGRTAFSTIVRESRDYVTVVMDAGGNAAAQSSHAIPSFISSVPRATRQILRRYPLRTLRPGDVLVSNDPFLGNGHLPDFVMIMPVFRGGRPVALTGAIAHVPDIGGRPLSPDAADLAEEGLLVPPMHYRRGGEENEDLLRIIQACVRVPDEVLGDLAGMVAALERADARVHEVLDDFGLDDLAALSDVLRGRAETAMRRAIGAWPDGVYRAELTVDAFDEPVTMHAAVAVAGSSIHVDYAGSSPQSRFGINVVPNYRYAHTAYALKCLLDPETPNNDGSFRPITDAAPEGSILNPARGCAVNARNLVGHAIPSLVFRALQEVAPRHVQGDSGGAPMWSVNCVGVDERGQPFAALQFFHGGQGGRAGGTGNDAFSFPSNCRVTPVELYERAAPILIESKLLIDGSGGRGTHDGGRGQRAVLRNVSDRPLTLYLNTEHIDHPPAGVLGGSPGRPGRVTVDGIPVTSKGRLVLAPGARLALETPGGGGWGRPRR